ncbi:hypothetical protein [Rhizobium chutanense]|uniref:Novel STAND NTPase 3 domain-containing protein n=1 Tax=Rhizobium chutanense TaxID=2035448 RepID=A0A2A6J692_9HYPH|nr:hypothetical protein [Rhizobium chutanense]PDT01605.1 hypothetical protein CO666_24220 [Rhizobium chutanense]
MSINITGPKKYDFQDIACVALGLQAISRPGGEFLIEPNGGEDCEIRCDGRIVEIQVKGAGGKFGLKELAEYLSHPGNKVANNTLLERLLADKARFVVLVLSSRCDDATSVLVEGLGWREKERGQSLNKADAKTLLAAYAKPSGERNPSKLTEERDRHRAAVAATLTPEKLVEAMRRVALVERLDEVAVTSVCEDLLVRAHDVPGDRTGDTIHRLREVIKDAKGNSENVLPQIQEVLDQSSHGSLSPEDYVERGSETVWQETLSQRKVLLLTGRPRTGKSNAARFIAARFQKLGYTVRVLSEVKEAERFLSEPGRSNRLAVLDDPLGGTHTEPEFIRLYQQLEDLIAHLRHDRRLIVAQSQEQLFAATNASDVGMLAVDGHPWHDLSQSVVTFSAKIWSQQVAQAAVPAELAQFVDHVLLSGKLNLDAGSIRHLARHHGKIRAPFTVDQLERIAHERASALADIWRSEGLQPLARSLAIGTNAMVPIAETELAFLLGKGGDRLPGMPDSQFTITSIGGGSPEPSVDPDYEEEPTLDQVELAGLDSLEMRRLISYPGLHQLNFSHPYYRAAGEASAQVSTQKQADEALSVLERALFCRRGSTSKAAARNLDWMHDRLKGSQRRDAIPGLAERGLKSYFPATRDLCYAFLLRHLPELPREFQSHLPDWVIAIRRRDVSEMMWQDDEARLPIGRTISGLERMEAFLSAPERGDVLTELGLLESSEETYLGPQGACRAVTFYKGEPAALGPQAMARLLNYGEGFIRAAAAKIWLSVDRAEDEDILRKLKADRHPAVASAILDGAVRGWSTLPQARKSRLIDIIGAQAAEPAAAAAMMPSLIRFDRIEYSGPGRAWDLFAGVMPIALDALPAGVEFTEARLFNVVMESRGKIAPKLLVRICDSWLHWLEKVTAEGLVPDDFTLGFADLLLDATRGNPEMREGRLARALALPGSTAPYAIIGDLVDHWDVLTDAERSLVVSMLGASRSDTIWLKASVLTSPNVPRDLEQLLLPVGVALNGPTLALVTGLADDLLAACVQAFTGQPPRLWNRAHRGADVWQPVVDLIVRQPRHPLFGIAWEAISGGGRGDQVRQIVLECGPSNAELFLDLLLRHKLSRVGDFMPEAWAAVLDQAPDRETRTEWLCRALIYSTAILDDLRDLDLWLLSEDDKRIALHFLEPDIESIMAANEISDGHEPHSGMNRLLEQFKKEPPRLHGTYGRIQRIVRQELDDDHPLYEALEAWRLRSLKLAEALKTHLLGDNKAAEPKGWIEP